MKKTIAIIAALILIAAVSGIAGYIAGKNHVITTQELWIMDFDQPDPDHDITIYADIDGDWQEYGGYIG